MKKTILMIAASILSIMLFLPFAFGEPAQIETSKSAATENLYAVTDSENASDTSGGITYVAPDEKEYQDSVKQGTGDEYQDGQFSSVRGAASGGAAQFPWLFVVAFVLVAIFAIICIVMAKRLGNQNKVTKKASKSVGAHSVTKRRTGSSSRR